MWFWFSICNIEIIREYLAYFSVYDVGFDHYIFVSHLYYCSLPVISQVKNTSRRGNENGRGKEGRLKVQGCSPEYLKVKKGCLTVTVTSKKI